MMCLILVILVSIVLMGINHIYSKTEVSYKEEFIYEGDTLWSISERELKENKYYIFEEFRDLVQKIKNIKINLGKQEEVNKCVLIIAKSKRIVGQYIL